MEEENGVLQLWNEDKAFIIILDAAGKTYSNQTGGVMCNHPEATGFLVEVPYWNGLDKYTETIPKEFVEEMNVVFRMFGFIADERDQEESWITGMYGDKPAILTYPNSD